MTTIVIGPRKWSGYTVDGPNETNYTAVADYYVC